MARVWGYLASHENGASDAVIGLSTPIDFVTLLLRLAADKVHAVFWNAAFPLDQMSALAGRQLAGALVRKHSDTIVKYPFVQNTTRREATKF